MQYRLGTSVERTTGSLLGVRPSTSSVSFKNSSIYCTSLPDNKDDSLESISQVNGTCLSTSSINQTKKIRVQIFCGDATQQNNIPQNKKYDHKHSETTVL